MKFSYEQFVEVARIAASEDEPSNAARAMLEDVVTRHRDVMQALPDRVEDEINLFEDQTVSVWACRFQPYVFVPPHEHKMNVHVGVIHGAETNALFTRKDGALSHVSTKVVRAGEVLTLSEHDIHSVMGGGDEPSYALHVYMGPLTQMVRSLFDWDTGAAVPFTDEAFERMTRSASDVEL